MPGGPDSWASSEASRRTMQANRGRDTEPEMRLRRALHSRGLRYRVQRRPVTSIRRTADIVFGPSKVAVLVHGCFWHGCPDHYVQPSSNSEYWTAKVESNRARDMETRRLWSEAGWEVVIVWEHEAVEEAAARIETLVTIRRPHGDLGHEPPPGATAGGAS